MFLIASTLPSLTDAVFTTGNPDGAEKRRRWVVAFGIVLLMTCWADQSKAAQPVQTTTTLTVTSAGAGVTTVASGSIVTLTARVAAGTSPVTPGQVNFCDAAAKSCTDVHLLGTAQLASAGTATLKFRPGIGNHSYKAVFSGTKTYASNSSGTTALTVTGTIPALATATAISETGGWGAYRLSATVTETGNTAAPTGSIIFLDANHGNAVLGTGTLGAATRGVNWTTMNTSAPNLAGVSYAVADLNRDGIPDLFVEDYFGTYDVLLGNGDGTFTVVGSPFGPYSQIGSFILGDFNNDGIPDVAAIDGIYLAPNNTITIFLGNGDGTFTVAGSSPSLGTSPGAIATADINKDGNADLIVDQMDSSGLGQIVIFFGNGDGTFTQAPSFTSLASTVSSIIPADLNGDGNIDLVLTGNTILLGKGDGTFTTVAGPANASQASASVADLNNDGIPDLVFEAATTSYLTVFLGNGDGTFIAAPSSANANLRIGNLAIGDFNRDGIPDIVYTVPGTTVVGLLFGKGDGSFVQTSATVAYGYDFNGNLVVGDFNGDGWPDVLTVDLSGRTIQDSLTQPTETASGSATVSIAVAGTHLADANYGGDSNYYASTSGNLSLWGAPPATTTTLTVNSGGAQVTSVHSGSVVTLTATVQAGATPVTAGQVSFCDATASLCADMHLLATVALTSNGTAMFKFVPGPGVHSYKAVFVQDGYGLTSSSAGSMLTVGPASSIAYTDTTAIAYSGLPGNYSLTATVVGYGGLTPPTGNVSFLDTSFGNTSLATAPLGASTPGLGWIISQTPALSTNPITEVAGDFNGDGIPDLALLSTDNTSPGKGTITILFGKGDGTFTEGPSTQAVIGDFASSGMMIVGDFNGDGKMDLAVLSSANGYVTDNVRIYPGNGDGTFQTPQLSTVTNVNQNGGDVIAGSMVAADFNGDGKLDLAIVGDYANDGGVNILLGNGDGTFRTGQVLAPNLGFGSIATGDFNGDGIPDLVVLQFFQPGGATVFLGKGDGTFAAMATAPPVDYFPNSIVVGDLNGDGKSDLAIGYSGAVGVLLGNGDGTFNTPSGSPFNGAGLGLAAGDFNHDGKLDLAGIDNYGDRIVLFLGAGDGTFTVASTTPVVSNQSPTHIVPADFNGDGVPDLALLVNYVNTASILLTEPTETATATVTGIAPVGAGTHNVEASYGGDSNYPSGVSGTVALTAGLTPLVISPAPGTYSTQQTVTISESIPGATIYYSASGTVNTNGFVVYTGPIQLTVGGIESIQAYATETGYQQTNYLSATYTINLPTAPAPQLSLSSGYYSTAQTLTISDTVPGASIYYTTNGQTPTQSSTLYAGPITVSTSETLAAVAISAGYAPSPVTFAQYVIGSSSSSFIYTVAGTGTVGYTGDGGSATLAELDSPVAVVKDAAGNIYIADQGNHVVRKVATGTGIISTVAGNGYSGYGGDGGLATSAMLSSPFALALDGSGNLYIADGAGTVREVHLTTGIISTYAGNPSGTSYVSGSIATAVMVPGIYGIAFDAAHNVYLSSQGSILKVTDSTRIITTLAGSGMGYGYGGDNGPAGSATFYYPRGLAFDAAGDLYVADEYNSVVRKIAATGGVITSNSIITTVAGIPRRSGSGGAGGPATSTLLAYPASLAVDGANNLYIGDVAAQIIWQLNPGTGNLTRFAGSGSGSCNSYGGDGGPAASTAVCYPYGLFVDTTGNLLIADYGFDRVRAIYSAALPPSALAVAPTFSLAPGTYPTAQTVTISDSTPGASIFVTIDGSTPTTLSNGYSFPINIAGAITIKAVATAPGYLTSVPASVSYAVTAFEPILSTIAGNGTFGSATILGLSGLGSGGPAANVEFAHPRGVAIDKAGNIFVSDYSNQIVWKFAAGTRTASVFAGTGSSGGASSGILATDARLYYPTDIAVDSAGNLYIADSGNYVVRKVNAASGIITTVAGSGVAYGTTTGDGGQATSASLYPNALAIDAADNLYIADSNHNEIRKVSAQTGVITAVAGNGTTTFSGDGGLATQAGIELASALAVSASGDIYFSSASSRIRKVTASTGFISTVAGHFGAVGETGDGGPATSAQVNVASLALDSGGDLYITNSPGTIRVLNTTTGVIGRVAGAGFPGFSGDFGPALTARLNAPNGLAFDSAGDLIVADFGNYRVRKISFAPQVVATPVISLPPGTYTSSQSVTISDTTSGSTIYYTMDGSIPTVASTAYSGPITVISSETLNAIAVAVNYNQSAVASATYTIKSPTTPAITWATPAAITYGTALTGSQLNATSIAAGSFAYTPAAGAVLPAGSQTLSVVFTPTDSANYSSATKTVLLTVNQAIPTITWAAPAPITFGTALSATQLNAAASIPGTFTYNPAAGTVPPVGTDTLSVTFTPTDSADYTTATMRVTLTVNNPAAVIGSISPAFTSAGSAAFTLTVNGLGFASSSAVYWGTTPLTTQYVSAKQLTAQVPATDIAIAGTTTITVQTQAPGAGTSNSLQFEVDSAGSGAVIPPSFTTKTATVSAGSAATYPVTLPSSATNVSVTCLNLPSGATCSYSSSTSSVTINTSSTTPAGTYQVTIVFTETLPGAGAAFVVLPFLLLPLMIIRRRLSAGRIVSMACLGIVLVAGTVVFGGCGGGGGGTTSNPPPSTHQVTSSGVVTLTVH